MPKILERLLETVETAKTRPILFGEGKLLRTVLQRLDHRRPGLIDTALTTFREWEPGRRVFGSKERR